MACQAEWLDAFVQDNGPYVYHITETEHRDSIVAKGLLPFDVIGRFSNGGPYLPRPGHVYFQQQLDIGSGLLALRLDLRDVDLARINPDEDAFWAADSCISGRCLDATLYGLDDPQKHVATIFNGLSPGAGRYDSYGQWAADNNIGDDPNLTHLAIETSGTLAICGALEASLFDFLEFDMDDLLWKRCEALTPA